MRKKHLLITILIIILAITGIILWNPPYFYYLYHSKGLAFAKHYTIEHIDDAKIKNMAQQGSYEVNLCSIKITEFDKPISHKTFEDGAIFIKFQNYSYIVKSLKPEDFGEFYSSLIDGINTQQRNSIGKETLSSFIEDVTTLKHADIKYLDGKNKTAIKVLKLALQPSVVTWDKFFTYESENKAIHITKNNYNETLNYIVHVFPENKNEFYEVAYFPQGEDANEEMTVGKLIKNISPSKKACSDTQITALSGNLAEK